MLPEAYACHRTSGRLRIKIPSRKGDSRYFSSLVAHFRGLQGIERVEVNATTGSLLLTGRPDMDEIGEFAAAKDLFTIRTLHSSPTALSARVLQDFQALDQQIKAFTGGEMDIPGLAFLGLVIAGIYQISIGNFAAPAWYTAFWYATGIFEKAYGGSRQGKAPQASVHPAP